MATYGTGLKTPGHLRSNNYKRSRRNRIIARRIVLRLRRVPPDYDFAIFAYKQLHKQVQSSKPTKVDVSPTDKEKQSIVDKIRDIKCFFFEFLPAIWCVAPMLLHLLVTITILVQAQALQDSFINDSLDEANVTNNEYHFSEGNDGSENAIFEAFEVKKIIDTIDMAMACINRGESPTTIVERLGNFEWMQKEIYRLERAFQCGDSEKVAKCCANLERMKKGISNRFLNNSPPNEVTTSIQIFVKDNSGHLDKFDVSLDTTIAEFRARVCKMTLIPLEELRFNFAGKDLQDELTMYDYNIEMYSTLHLCGRLRGGCTPPPPTLSLKDGTVISLSLPLDPSMFYSKEEILKMTILYGKKEVLDALDSWAELMRKKHNMGTSTKSFGPKRTQATKLLPTKTNQTIREEDVKELLRGLVVGKDEWKRTVNAIAGDEPVKNPGAKGMRYGPTIPEIHRMIGYQEESEHVVEEDPPLITPDASCMSSAGSFFNSTDAANVDTTSTLEPVTPLRDGRWSREELKYAEALIQLFQEGWIPIENGTTLRAFLSSVLQCSPKRISDRFKGDMHEVTIGNVPPFLRDMQYFNDLDPDTIETTHSQLRQMENNLLRESDTLQPIFQQEASGPLAAIITEGDYLELVMSLALDKSLCDVAKSDTSLRGIGKRMKGDAATKRLGLIKSVLEGSGLGASSASTSSSAQRNEARGAQTTSTFEDGNTKLVENVLTKEMKGAELSNSSSSSQRSEAREVQTTSTFENGNIDKQEQRQPSLSQPTPIVSPSSAADTKPTFTTMKQEIHADDNILTNYELLQRVVSNLDWEIRPRPTRNRMSTVEIHDNKQADKDLRTQIMLLTREVFINNRHLDYSNKKIQQEVQNVAEHLLFYDHGYKEVKHLTERWEQRWEEAVLSGENDDPFKSNHKGRTAIVDQLERKYPGKMREYYERAQKKIGYTSTFEDLASNMNILAKEEGLDDFHLNKDSVWRWFKKNGGNLRSPKPKPQLTDDLKKRRLEWAKEMLQMIREGKWIVYLDEKWFYTTSLRRKIKQLPGQDIVLPTTVSRRNVPKVSDLLQFLCLFSIEFCLMCCLSLQVMNIGVVAKPVPSENFDGKILLKRIAEETEYQQVTYNRNFTDSAEMNQLLKGRDWQKLVEDPTEESGIPAMTLGELRGKIAEEYKLSDYIRDKIVLRNQCPWVDDETGKKPKATFYIKDGDWVPSVEDLEAWGDQWELRVRYEKGDKRVVDVNCDSEFMLSVMPEVGAAIREKMHFVDPDEPIYLVLDNAGGHGTDEAIEQYVTLLREEYNVICHHQCPRSPETNMLDLGIWMSLQNIVERLHIFQRHEKNALQRTVYTGFEDMDQIKFEKVAKRIEEVLRLIIADNGGNRLVETNRGRVFREPSSEPENENLAQDEESEELNQLYDAESPEEEEATTGFEVDRGTEDDELESDIIVSGDRTDANAPVTGNIQKQRSDICKECRKQRRMNAKCCRGMCKPCCDSNILYDDKICTAHGQRRERSRQGERDPTILVFPFPTQEEQLRKAASGLNELRVARESLPEVDSIVASEGSRASFTVMRSDLGRTHDGIYMNDHLIDFCMEW